MTNIPRRNHSETMTPAEKAISAAMEAVEKLPPDVRLTDAVVLLDRARNKVADFVDGIDGSQGRVVDMRPDPNRVRTKEDEYPIPPAKQNETKQFRTREVYKLGNITVAYDEDEGYKLIVPAGVKPDLAQLYNDAAYELCSCEQRIVFLRNLVLDLAMRSGPSKKPEYAVAEPRLCGDKFTDSVTSTPRICTLPWGHYGPHAGDKEP